MPLAPGTRLGPYEITSPLGAGGMGEVYRARDTRLGRDVAIKALPEELARDREHVARFLREGRALASLNHPNISAIHGLEESGDRSYLVLEFVEGPTLAERLHRGPLPLAEVIRVCRQIAAGLEAAHESGIVHRDLKPSNVMLNRTDGVKVLDFGLAKDLGANRDAALTATATLTGTTEGTVLGTPAYMSPEQASGRATDRRTDIWAFGCVLYECLVGRPVFAGGSFAEIVAQVLKAEPDLAALPAATPDRVRELVDRCLTRDPTQRLRDIGEARIALQDTADRSEPDVPAALRRAVPWWFAAVTLGAAVLTGLAVWRFAPRRVDSHSPVVAKLARITHDAARAEWPTWSPDGALLAYASDRSGNSEIYVRRGEGGQDVAITNDPAEDVQPAFSPDGASIAFVSTRSSKTGLIRIGGTFGRSIRTYGGDLWLAPALGGAARRLASDANFPAWRPDGTAIVFVTGPENHRAILEVPSGGGPLRTILPSEESMLEVSRIACSPDGRWISLETEQAGLLLMPAAGSKPRPLCLGFGHAWDRTSGRLYFLLQDPQGGTRIQFIDPGADPFAAGPRTVGLMTASFSELAVTSAGLKIAMPEKESARILTRNALAPGGGTITGPEEPLTRGLVTNAYPSVSPDGRRVAVVSDVLGYTDVRIVEVASHASELVELPGEDIAQVSPVWMPDGRHLLTHRSLPGSRSSIWIVALDGSEAVELVVHSVQGTSALATSPDGKMAYYQSVAGDSVQQVFVLDLASRKATQLTDTPGDKFDTVASPDGRWLAITATKDGTTQLFRMPASGGSMQQLTTGHERMRHPFFSPDGRWIYIQPSHRNIYRVRAEGGPLEQVTHFPEGGLFLEEPTISPDGRFLYYCRGVGGSAMWLVTLEDPDRRP